MKKKPLIIILVIIALVAVAVTCAICFTVCSKDDSKNGTGTEEGGYISDSENSDNSEHSHIYTESVVKSDCTEQGYTLHTCECGDSYKDNYTKPLGHTEVIDAAVSAECTKTGLTEGKHCSVCGTVLVEQTIIQSKGHTEITDDAVAASCTDTGLTEGKHCAVCSTVLLKQQVVNELGHNYIDGKCSRCGEIKLTEGLAYTLNPDGNSYHISGLGKVTDSYIKIPSTIEGVPITSIGEMSFINQDGIKGIVIPDTVTSICERAFINCDGLESLEIPNSVSSIGASAFENCSALKSVTLYEGVEEIGWGAFSRCSSLTEINYKGSIVSWCGITGLYSIMANKRVLNINGEKLKGDIIIPEEVTTIKEYVFSNCEEITSITIPESVQNIGEGAFSECNGLLKVNYAGDINDWCKILFNDSSSNPLCYAHDLYIDNELVTEVTISAAVNSIGNFAFYGCDKLVSVTISDGLNSIGNYSFMGCNNLKNLTISKSITTIGNSAFDGCGGLVKVNYTGDLGSWCEISFISLSSNPLYYTRNFYISEMRVTEYLIPDGVSVIGDNTFPYYGYTNLKIPDSVTAIGDCTFIYGGLKSIIISKNITSIGSSAFFGCGLTKVYYTGTEEDWSKISIGGSNESLINATKYFYCETQPTETGNYWHYVDGEAVEW